MKYRLADMFGLTANHRTPKQPLASMRVEVVTRYSDLAGSSASKERTTAATACSADTDNLPHFIASLSYDRLAQGGEGVGESRGRH
jgi:hypothetical protein